MNHKLSMTRVFDDPSPDAQINNRYFNGIIPIVAKTTLSNNDKDQIVSLITLLSMKLVSLWEIKEQYKAVLKQVKEELAKSPKGGNDNLHAYTIQSSGLMGWFDVFLVQIKSILDHLVKIPSPIFGYNKWNLATFGEKGEKVKKAFSNLPKEYKQRTQNYYEQIFGNQYWIHDVIEMRDKLNHGVKGGMGLETFSISYDEAKKKFYQPMWSKDQTIEDALEILFGSVLKTTSIFCGLMLSLKLPDSYTVICDPNKIPICQVISKTTLKQHLESKNIYAQGL